MSRASSAGGVERFAQADRAFAVTAAAWDRDLWLLGTPGGTVELRTGEIRPASPADMITRLTAATPIPLADFKPSRDCPRWLAFLDDATGTDADAIRFIQQWAGYSLTGDTREEALLFVHGPGGSGKSTAINTLADVMGDYAVNVAAETITASKWDRHSTELARLHNARMARASETEAGRAWAESRLKALTGGDKITARFMRCDDFEFKPAFKLTIIGNHAPRIVNVDEAMRRRFNVLPFTHPPQRADSSLKDALQAEWPAILSWAMLGCLDWQRQGLTRPAVVVQATEAYFADQDTFALWLDECCEVGKGFSATTANLSLSFRSFALRAGDETPMGSKGFSQLMQARGFQPIKDALGMRGRGFAGLRLRNDFNEECEAQGV
jgi:putative DNA primase/helicase